MKERIEEIKIESAPDILGLYLKEAADHPILSREEERELARRYKRGRKAQMKLSGNGDNPLTERKLQKLIKTGQDARERLIKSNFRLVISIAKRFHSQDVPILDLIQEGNIGLMKAVDRFDPERGFTFATYATWWIFQAIQRASAELGRTIRLPTHLAERISQVGRIEKKLEQELGRQPSKEEIATHLGGSVGKVEKVFRVRQPTLSLEKPVGNGQEPDEASPLGDFIPADVEDPLDAAERSRLAREMRQALDTLSEKEKRIIELRFGLEDGIEYTLEQVGEKLGVTRERIRQIELKALHKLRHPTKARKLKEYL